MMTSSKSLFNQMNLDEFLTSPFYYGKTVGRTAGRLFHPSYSIGDTEYLLDETSNPSFLHGGENGFSFKHFEIVIELQ
jgi:aldose 1-epimerase